MSGNDLATRIVWRYKENNDLWCLLNCSGPGMWGLLVLFLLDLLSLFWRCLQPEFTHYKCYAPNKAQSQNRQYDQVYVGNKPGKVQKYQQEKQKNRRQLKDTIDYQRGGTRLQEI